MEKQERVVSQLFTRDLHDIARTRKSCMSVSHAPFRLKAPHPQPFVRERKAHTAMVILPIGDPHGASLLEDRAVLRHTVRNAREEFRQVERGVGVMTNPEEQHLPIQIVHPTDRTFGDVGRKRERVGGDRGSFRPVGCAGEEVIAAQHTGQPPERVRYRPEVRRRWRGRRLEGLVVVPRPGRHHQSAFGAESIT
jgi:hypothetical protein